MAVSWDGRKSDESFGSQHSLDCLEMVWWESVSRGSLSPLHLACTFTWPDWLPLGLRGWGESGLEQYNGWQYFGTDSWSRSNRWQFFERIARAVQTVDDNFSRRIAWAVRTHDNFSRTDSLDLSNGRHFFFNDSFFRTDSLSSSNGYQIFEKRR